MKKLVPLLSFLLTAMSVLSQRTIQMEYINGVYRIPCVVNGAQMKMVFDTGASSVSLSLATALFLYQNGYISDNDFRDVGKSSTASGEIVDHMKLNIKDIEIGGLHLYNVEGIVMESLTAPLLLGQTAIQKLGTITIQGDKLIINSATPINKTYKPGEIFYYYEYKIPSSVLIMALEENLYDNIWWKTHSYNRKQNQARVVMEIIEFIKKGDISFKNNNLVCSGSALYWSQRERKNKEYSYLQEAGYYVGQIARGLVEKGQYIE